MSEPIQPPLEKVSEESASAESNLQARLELEIARLRLEQERKSLEDARRRVEKREVTVEPHHRPEGELQTELTRLQQAMRTVKMTACEALAESPPNGTILIVKLGNGDIVACRPVADDVARSVENIRLIHEAARQCGAVIEFAVVQGNPLLSAAACRRFIQRLEDGGEFEE